MEVDGKPEVLERAMYKATGELAVERPVIVQENDIDGEFTSTPGAIPSHLLDLIHAPRSSDPVTEEVEQVSSDLKVDAEKVAEENPNSRFRILDVAQLKPGVCALCASSGGDGRQFVDFGKSVDWYGVVYFCTFCVIEAAKLLGLTITQAEFDGMAKGYGDEIESADDRWVKAQEEIRAFRLLLRNCRCNDDDNVSDDYSPSETSSEDSEESVGDSNRIVEGSDVEPDDPVESSGVEESGDVPEASVDDISTEKPKRTRRTSSSAG